MSQKKELEVDDSEYEDLGLTVVYVFCGFLVVWALRKMALVIVTYAEASVKMLVESLLEEQMDRAEMNFARPPRLAGHKDVACDADEKGADEIDGGRGKYCEGIAVNCSHAPETTPSGRRPSGSRRPYFC
ncbi:uncharacterized protein LOC142557490 isoform X2 [Dermacentor variabilis]